MRKLLFLLTILFLTFFVQSCKTKSKVTEREKVKVEIEASEIKEEAIKEVIKVNSLENSRSVTKEVSDNSTEEIEADSTGTVTVEVIKTDTGYIKTYTGVKKVKTTNDTKEIEKVDTTALKTLIEGEKETTKKEESFIKFKQETKTRKTDVEIKSTSTWFWIILALVIIFLIWVNRKRLYSLFG